MASITRSQADRFDGPTRYVLNARAHFDALRRAAEQYPDAVAADVGLGWMRRKPYDPSVGHPNFFNCVYAAMNAIQAMRLPPNALVVEVGAGPGWMTQILVGLGYRVVAIEPSATMNELAVKRVAGFSAMTGVPADSATFLTATLEEADLKAYQGQVDAVMFHEALHHVIDEHEAMRQVFSLLQPGGCLAVCGEGRWNPGDRNSESKLDEEMKRYGTLESPFTQAYLRHLLNETGFSEIVFYHSVNGLFPESQETKMIRDVANPSASAANTVLAWRPLSECASNIPRLTRFPDRTKAIITLLRTEWNGDYLTVEARLRNSGETYWPIHQPPSTGGVTLALVQDSSAVPPPEAANRYQLPKAVFPGEQVVVNWQFDARGLDKAACRLRLVAEDAFWFPGGVLV
jgi:SAM-dependent methyltransferase